MTFSPPDRVPLARLPTPLEAAPRLGQDLGVDLWVKRDDLTGMPLSGNKVRKLEFLVAEAQRRGARVLVTCGAVGSNHARATAVAAARLGLESHLLLRGEEGDMPDGNLLIDRLLGAGTTFIPHDAWKDRDRLMEEIATRLAAKGKPAYTIPEGGSNGLGALGYVVGAEELLAQAETEGVTVRRVIHATGSGGTTAGLALGIAVLGRDDVEVIGVAVCDDRATFDAKIGAILDEAVLSGWVTEDVRKRARWTILEGYQGEGYAKTTPGEMRELARVARAARLLLDPVYTGKAWHGLLGEARAGRLEGDGATVFLHTGGLFGLFAFADEIRSL